MNRRASRAPYPCLFDTASLVGLRPLVHDRPGDWRRLLHHYAPPAPPIHPTTTLADVLGTSFDTRCLPGPTTSRSSLSAARSYARRLRELLPGDLVLTQLDGRTLDQLRARLGGHVGDSVARRLVAHLRGLAHDVRLRVGMAPAAKTRARPTAGSGARRSNHSFAGSGPPAR